MGQWLIAILLCVMVLFRGGYSNNDTASDQSDAPLSTQKAAMVIGYLNAINDYLYDHPLANGVVPDGVLNFQLPDGSGIHNVVQDSRVMVYLPDKPGLVSALRSLSRHSALLCHSTRGVLTDLSGTSTGISAPTAITGGDLVYLN
ncbi:type IV pilus biogenesis protein PilM [Enterobacter asburiae]|uniref:type IV pilus biogenesis protein PilM n=1 Tax=Enterobacter asburiae TaxID=61645 RepID=UPI003F57C9E4